MVDRCFARISAMATRDSRKGSFTSFGSSSSTIVGRCCVVCGVQAGISLLLGFPVRATWHASYNSAKLITPAWASSTFDTWVSFPVVLSTPKPTTSPDCWLHT